jgi:hypothetical protein
MDPQDVLAHILIGFASGVMLEDICIVSTVYQNDVMIMVADNCKASLFLLRVLKSDSELARETQENPREIAQLNRCRV